MNDEDERSPILGGDPGPGTASYVAKGYSKLEVPKGDRVETRNKKMQLDVSSEPPFRFAYMKCIDKQPDMVNLHAD